MARIAIAGAGISGLTLALRLQQLGVETTLWTDRTPDQIRAGQVLNLVARFQPTLARERALGVDHWDFPDFAMSANTYLELAGRGSLESGAYEDAAARFRRAIGRAPAGDPATRARLLAGLGHALCGLAGRTRLPPPGGCARAAGGCSQGGEAGG